MKPWLYAVVFLSSALAPTASRQGDGGSTSRPDAERRIEELRVKIESMHEMAARLQRNEAVSTDDLEAAFPAPPADAERRTRDLREDVLTLEEAWIAARAARTLTVDRVEIERGLAPPETPDLEAPSPHPLAGTQALPLARIRFRRGRYERALEILAAEPGAEARYLEARCLDALDMVPEALAAYKKAREAASGDAALLATVERAAAALDWKIRFGRPEQLLAPLRNSRFSGFQSLQDAAGAKNGVQGVKSNPEEGHANGAR